MFRRVRCIFQRGGHGSDAFILCGDHGLQRLYVPHRKFSVSFEQFAEIQLGKCVDFGLHIVTS